MNIYKKIRSVLVLIITVMGVALSANAATIINHNCTNIDSIPESYIEAAKSQLHVVYQHTSHGSQLITGMNVLANFSDYGDRFAWDDSGQDSSALDFNDEGIPAVADLSEGDVIESGGVTAWAVATRELLDNPNNLHVNVVMWSWCSINGHDIDRYLDSMETLIAEYGPDGTEPRAAEHPVQFVFMTGHAEGQGEDGFVHSANEQIRSHCRSYNRVLYDFADIESYDPDGNYYLDRDMWDNLDYTTSSPRDSNWAENWIAANSESELAQLTRACHGCAHSGSDAGDPAEANLNCILKGRAAWWLMARLAGWNTPDSAPGGSSSSGSSSSGGGSDGASVSCFIQTAFRSFFER